MANSMEAYRKNKPGVQFSGQDLALADRSEAFAQALMTAKDLAAAAGTDGDKMRAANALAESARARYGSYLGGEDGSAYLPLGSGGGTSPYAYLDSQLNGAADALRGANNSALAALEEKKDALRYSAKKEQESQTAGYFQGLDSLDEAMANSGYDPMGGQNRTQKAEALSTLYEMQNATESALRQSVAEVEIAIGQLVAEGKQQEARQLFENAKLWVGEHRQRLEHALKERQFEYGKEQDLARLQLDEGKLLGIYRGQDTLDKQKEQADASRSAKELAYRYAVLAENRRKAAASAAAREEAAAKKAEKKQKEETDGLIKKEASPQDQEEIDRLVTGAIAAKNKREQELLEEGAMPNRREYTEWASALMYIDQNAPLANGIEAIYALGAPSEYVWSYLESHYGARNEDLAQVDVPGHALYLYWKDSYGGTEVQG